jgi:hypothetical protein
MASGVVLGTTQSKIISPVYDALSTAKINRGQISLEYGTIFTCAQDRRWTGQ